MSSRLRHNAGALVALLGLATAVPASAQGARGLGIDTTNFDHSVRPQDDFFRYVNGGWLKSAAIPNDASSWGAFNELSERSRTALHSILEDAASSSARAGTDERKVGDLYASYLDTARIERLGLTPLAGELRAIASARTMADLPVMYAGFARIGVGSPLSVGVGQDQKASTVNILQVGQGGLGMPDRDYYLRSDPKSVAVRDAYRTYITTMMTLAKQPDPAGAANRIIALETALAGKQWDRARLRDRNATYNRMTVDQLVAMSPHYDLRAYLRAAGLRDARDVIVRQPDYIGALDSILAATPVSTLREYQTLKLLDRYAGELPGTFRNARFAFRGRTLSGQQEEAALWKRAVGGTEGILGEPAGKLYVAKNFRPEAKARMDRLVANLREAYRIGIDSLEWMSPETKMQAKDKLSKFTVKIGYPDKPRNFSALVIRRTDAIGNAMRSNRYQYADMMSQLGKPVDRARWGMTPQTVNAYYNSVNNEIVFPAAILQPPFFDPTADDAVNYGGIGAVIGHEIGHGFDDQGRKSDGLGNLRDWWTADDAKAFDERTRRLGEQYAALTYLDDMHINPALTMGENIGDLSGLAQAYRAYHLSLNGQLAPVIGGLTGDQRFFMGYAQIWRAKYRDEALRQQLLTNPHSPGMARAYIPLVNNDAFARTFDLKPGDKMYVAPENRVKIW